MGLNKNSHSCYPQMYMAYNGNITNNSVFPGFHISQFYILCSQSTMFPISRFRAISPEHNKRLNVELGRAGPWEHES